MDKDITAVWNRTRQRFWNALAADCELRLEEELAEKRFGLAALVERYRHLGAREAMQVAHDAIAESSAVTARVHSIGSENRPSSEPPALNDGGVEGAVALPGPNSKRKSLKQRKSAKGGLA